ncbi:MULTISPECIES: restriction endonuclease subunit S [Bacillus]|uniref:restriction endonuclease subunit S n=1 Tax=Bacillus TaxID=1386 RepID=UPI00031E2628|nr:MULTISPECIES: restriction endonuclease subunit S [Bacillus]HWO76112.1 restriction endonuclease subunit S [Bacillus sp. (in: firmicutes)]MBC9089762.1 restriction endonuclease subunit S [Bacillus sp. Y1]MBU8784272.1 restriction endonuclease subunit S [Bacillus licheniformis]MDE1411109.1 restriction endonuclease subunit S [Bacillus licheniformis]MDE1419906.1 restriction endonuclease subunit S [Bacillus licheniformis]
MSTDTLNGWKKFKLSEVISFLGGNAFKSTDAQEYGIRWLKIANVGFGKIEWSNLDFLPNEFLEEYSKYLLRENDIVMALTRPILNGKLKIAKVRKEDTPSLLNQRVAKITANDGFSLDFLYFVLSKRSTVMKIENAIAGTDPPNLGFNDLKNVNILAPINIKEQQKIATILSTWDKAIELKEKLIEQKKEQKKGLMQKLLTGEVRLPGYKDEWKIVRLGEIGKTYNGLSGKSAEDFGEGKPYIPYKTIFDDAKIDLNKLDYVEIEAGENQNSAKYGDIFFTTSSETPDEVAISSVLLDHVNEIYLNSFCFGYRLNNFSVLLPEFAQFLFRSDGFRRKTFSLAQGSTRFNISKNEVMKIEVSLPSIEEQKSIAEILSYSDKEIKLLDKQVDFLKQQKKGLMQLLLTGKVRVQV